MREKKDWVSVVRPPNPQHRKTGMAPTDVQSARLAISRRSPERSGKKRDPKKLPDSSMKLLRLTIQPPSNSPKNDLQNPSTAQRRPALPQERHRINDIPHIAIVCNISKIVVQFLQMLCRLRITPDLEELDSDLPRRRLKPIELLRGLDQRAFEIVRRHAVGDADDVDWFGGFGPRLVVREVLGEDVVESAADGGCAAGAHGLEDFADGAGARYVAVVGRLRVVEEVDVDSVGVVRCADGGDGHQGVGCLAPEAAGHGAGIVYYEDRVESVEECVCFIGDGCWC